MRLGVQRTMQDDDVAVRIEFPPAEFGQLGIIRFTRVRTCNSISTIAADGAVARRIYTISGCIEHVYFPSAVGKAMEAQNSYGSGCSAVSNMILRCPPIWEALESDLIVIVNHGQPERDEMLLGSVTTRVIQDAGCEYNTGSRLIVFLILRLQHASSIR